MNPRPLIAALPLALVLLVGACGGSSSKTTSPAVSINADGNKTAFCATNAAITEGTKSATSAAEFVTQLSPFQSQLDAFLADAPAGVKTDATTLVVTARTALSQNDGTGFTDPAVVQAGKNVDQFCVAG
jgi:hypothetical protein